MWHTYHTPTTLDDALDVLARHGPDARIVAGGTDLLIELERGLRTPGVLIDVSRIGGLDEITLDDQERIHLGPLVTHNRVAGSALCVARAFPLARACWEVGSPQIRNRGTVAGNLITASPANDTIPALWALDAVLTLRSVRGERTSTLEQFYRGVRRVDLAPDEMLVDIAFPALKDNERGTFVKFALRRAQAIAVVNVAVVMAEEPEDDFPERMLVDRVRIALGSVAPTIVRATHAEEKLVAHPLSPYVIRRAGEMAVEAARPIDDVRGSAAYRREMVRVCVRRALQQLADHTERAGWPARPVMLWGRGEGRAPALPRAPCGDADSATRTHAEADAIETTINGRPYHLAGAQHKTLLRLLREDAGLTGTKEGCAEGECGACTVFLDGAAVMACLVPAPRAHGAEIVTIEGLAGNRDGLHPLQQAFVDCGAVQCGYCTPGFVMAGAKLLEERVQPGEDEIRHSITGNLCRCTGYYKIMEAFRQAAHASPSEGKGALHELH
jgi:xanthine dehydrogenase iron-sulfur cluster and FAD-binding subunit A